jgi:hypothetical protein
MLILSSHVLTNLWQVPVHRSQQTGGLVPLGIRPSLSDAGSFALSVNDGFVLCYW